MRRLFDLGFFITIAMACVALDFYILKRDNAGLAFGLQQYFAQRKEDLQDLLKPPSLAAALPSEIAGWDVRPAGADQMIPGSADSRAQQASEIAMIKAVAALEKASHPAGDMAGMTLTKGDTRLRVMAVLAKPTETIAGIETISATPESLDPALQALMQQNSVQTDTAPYSVVDGVAFTELPAAAVSGDAGLRMMRATLGAEISVTVVTKSTDDAAIREAMQAIDFVMLNKLLQKPVAGVANGRTTDVRLDPVNALSPDEMAQLTAQQEKAALGAPLSSTADKALAADATADLATGDETLSEAAPKPKAAPAETAVFVAPPEEGAGTAGQPCVRRAGVLVCPDG